MDHTLKHAFCPYCGAFRTAGETICKQCGRPFPQDTPLPEQKQPRSLVLHPLLLIAGAVGLLTVIGLIWLSAVLRHTPKQTGQDSAAEPETVSADAILTAYFREQILPDTGYALLHTPLKTEQCRGIVSVYIPENSSEMYICRADGTALHVAKYVCAEGTVREEQSVDYVDFLTYVYKQQRRVRLAVSDGCVYADSQQILPVGDKAEAVPAQAAEMMFCAADGDAGKMTDTRYLFEDATQIRLTVSGDSAVTLSEDDLLQPGDIETVPAVIPPETSCQRYLDNVLIPEYGLVPEQKSLTNRTMFGVASALISDFSGAGTVDMLVIRVEYYDASCVPTPVFVWYRVTDGVVTELDSAECQAPWSEYTVSIDGQRIYVSGSFAFEDSRTADGQESLKYTTAILSAADGKLKLLDLQESYADTVRPPAAGTVLMRVERDTSVNPAHAYDRCYILHDETTLHP